jgi:RNA polymerase sigma-70 factor, ECF subfamily
VKELYELYYERLVYFGRRFIADRQAVEDIAVDVFVRLFESGYKNAEYALFTAMKNACKNHVRNEDRRHLIIDRLFTEEIAELEIIESGVIKILMSALDKLPAESKQVIEMFYFDGKSCVEIGHEINKPADTVRSLKRSGLNNLFKKLK